MDAVIQHVGACKVLEAAAHCASEREHGDLGTCGQSCRCPAEGQRPVLADPNAKSCCENVALLSSQEKKRESCKEKFSILGNLQLLTFFFPLSYPSVFGGEVDTTYNAPFLCSSSTIPTGRVTATATQHLQLPAEVL